MPEPFKNNFNAPLIRAMAKHLARAMPEFNQHAFIAFTTDGLERLELKQRADRITDGLKRYLPKDFPTAAQILVDSLAPAHETANMVVQDGPDERGIKGWPVMAMAEYVARHGQGHVTLSLDVLKDMTSRFSSEFAIRTFLINYPQQTMETLAIWTNDDNEHVRRLASEGSRPRLPWGQRLHAFVNDPSPVIDLLEKLKDDPSEYVRRSVANNLNDISKDHPEMVADIATSWMTDANHERQRLIRHGLRTLIKVGNKSALQALGYGPAKIIVNDFALTNAEVTLGEALNFNIEIISTSNKAQPLVIDYAIHHQRANGQTIPKVFKWKTVRLHGHASLTATKRHTIKPITTRRYYPGLHHIEVLINGERVARADFELLIP